MWFLRMFDVMLMIDNETFCSVDERGDITKCDNCKDVMLLNTIYKIFITIFLGRRAPYL